MQVKGVRAGVVALALSGGLAVAVTAAAAGARTLSVSSADALYPGLTSLAEAKQSTLSPRLLALTRAPLASASANTRADALDLPRSGGGSLTRLGADGFLVYVFVRDTAQATLDALRAAGLTPTNVSGRYGVVTGSVALSDLTRLAQTSGVKYVDEVLQPFSPTEANGAEASLAGSSESCGSKTSEGVRQLSADSARGAYGVDGSGVEVGILADSFDTSTTAVTSAAQDVASGDLPGAGNPCGHATPVDVAAELPIEGTDSGRAYAQIAHDVAPGASLAFATAYGGVFAMGDNIRALAAGGAKVLMDDLTYGNEPMFQEGPISAAISDVVSDGAVYVTYAGDQNLEVGGEDVGSYEAPAYRPTPCDTEIANLGYTDCHDFTAPGGGADNDDALTVAAGGDFLVDLQWAEPWFGVATDFDVFLVNGSGTVLAQSIRNSIDWPYEILSWTNGGSTANVRLVIARNSGTATPRLKFVIIGNGVSGITSVEHGSPSDGGAAAANDVFGPTIFGHNGSADAITVGAVNSTDRNTTYLFSSHGPRTLYYAPVSGSTPAAPLGSPEVISAPQVAATTGVANTFYGVLDAGTWRLWGNAPAAAHIAGIAALIADRAGSVTRTEVLDALESTAHPVANDGGTEAVGAGLADALGAVGEVVPWGFLRVVSSPAVPTQIVVDGEIADNWGTTWVKVPAGSHTVSFTDVQGYTTPADQNVNVSAGGTTVVTGTFAQRGLLRVLTSPALPASISVDGVVRNDYGMWTWLPTGAHTVCYGPVEDWLAPTCDNVNLSAGTQTTATGTYTSSPGAPGEASAFGFLRVTTSPAVPSQISVDDEIADNWGLTWVKSGSGGGTLSHTVSFSDVEGYTTPADQNVDVTTGATTTVQGTFVPRGLLRVMTSPAIPGNGATVFVDGIPRNDFGVWTWFPTGEHEVCYGYLGGFVAPACETVNLSAGVQSTVTGTYTADP